MTKKDRRRVGRVLIFLAVVVSGGVLGYGYWFGATHGALYIYVDQVSGEHSSPIVPIRISFLDAEGQTLAEAEGVPPDGTIFLISPPLYACHEAELQASFAPEANRKWHECFERQSRWIPTWIKKVAGAELQSGSCALGRKTVRISEYPDTWWLWWVPLRHIGGKPYTGFSARIAVERIPCNDQVNVTH